jgi:hypothetical protein
MSNIRYEYNNEMTKKLNTIKQKSWSYTWLHRENERFLKNKYDRLSYLNIGLDMLTATSIFATANTCDETYYAKIITGVISVISGYVAGVLKFQDYGQEIAKHRDVASKYSIIYNTIDRQLSTPFEAQEQFHHFHNWVSKDFDALYSIAPDLEDEVIQKYIEKFGDKRNVHPIEAAEYDKNSSKEITPPKTPNIKPPTTTPTTPRRSKKTDWDKKTDKTDDSGKTNSSILPNTIENTIETVDFSDTRDDGIKEHDVELGIKKRDSRRDRKNKTKTQSEKDLKEYVRKYQNDSNIGGERFNSGMADYQFKRLHSNKCYIDPIEFR